MNFFRRLAVSALMLACAGSGAWASGPTTLTSVALTDTNPGTYGLFTVGNDTFTISNCSTSSQDGVDCSDLKITGSVFRGVVTLSIVNKTQGSSIISDGSSSGGSTLGLTITVSNVLNKTYQTISSVNSITTGTLSSSSYSASGKYVVSGTGFGDTTLLDTLSTTNGAPSDSTDTGSASTTPWTITTTISLNDAGHNSSNNILTGMLVFQKAPEPASISLVLMGVGGLAAARRRRRKV